MKTTPNPRATKKRSGDVPERSFRWLSSRLPVGVGEGWGMAVVDREEDVPVGSKLEDVSVLVRLVGAARSSWRACSSTIALTAIWVASARTLFRTAIATEGDRRQFLVLG